MRLSAAGLRQHAMCADAETEERGALCTLGNPITRAARTSPQHLRGDVRLLRLAPFYAGIQPVGARNSAHRL